MDRRLATILAADAVGFSAHMERDEEATLIVLKGLREIIDAEVESYGGRVFNSAGDSVVAEFSSPVEAVRCAVSIQSALAKKPDIPFRIGVHLGDILVDGDNLMGDGVNVAARLEQLAPPGGICISKPLADLVLDKIDAAFSFAGEQKLKNISKIVGVWVWPEQNTKLVSSPKFPMSKIGLPTAALVLIAAIASYIFMSEFGDSSGSSEPTLAVMAFRDESPGPDRGYLSNAIAEGIVNEVSRFDSFRTVARNSSFRLSRKNANVEEIREALDADFILEGSQQKVGENLLISAQLIDAHSGDHIWAESFEGEVGQLFEFQGKIVRSVAATVGGRLSHYTPPHGTRGTVTAMHLAVEGRKYLRKGGRENNERAAELYREAIEADPNSYVGYLSMGFYHRNMAGYANSAVDREEALRKAEDMAAKAQELDSDEAAIHYLLGRLQVDRGNLEASLRIFEKVKELNPSFSNVYVIGGTTKLYLGDVEGAISDIQYGMEIDPLHPPWFHSELARALWAVRKCPEALKSMQQIPKPSTTMLRYLSVIQVCNGNIDGAQKTMAKFLEALPNRSLSFEVGLYSKVWNASGGFDRWLDDLRTAGMPE